MNKSKRAVIPPQVDRSPDRRRWGGDAVDRERCRKLVRRHLGPFLDRLFAEFTGIHFHTSWSPALPRLPGGRILPFACAVCRRLARLPRQRVECATCGPRHLPIALHSSSGHRFTCRLGTHNFWIPIRADAETLGLAYLQALASAPAGLQGQTASRRGETRVLSRMDFIRAARFLRFIVQHAETSILADLRLTELTSARHALVALNSRLTREHERLRRHLPQASETPRASRPITRGELVVNRLLEHVEQNYNQPVRLKQRAAEMGMNPSYICALFSRSVGQPFKTYLTELRLEKAKELLSDADRDVSNVAYAVGYAGENQFRIAFKKATGLAPKLWREVMQWQPPAWLSPSSQPGE